VVLIALITPQCETTSAALSTGNDLTGRGALPMFPAARSRNLDVELAKN